MNEEPPRSPNELEIEKTELLQEKNENLEKLREINLKLKSMKGDAKTLPLYQELEEERKELINDNMEIETEIREINTRILNLNKTTSHRDLPLVVQLVAAYIASGLTTGDTAEQVTHRAIQYLTEIRHALNTIK